MSHCPHCQQSLDITGLPIGQMFSCPICGGMFRIPQQSHALPSLQIRRTQSKSVLILAIAAVAVFISIAGLLVMSAAKTTLRQSILAVVDDRDQSILKKIQVTITDKKELGVEITNNTGMALSEIVIEYAAKERGREVPVFHAIRKYKPRGGLNNGETKKYNIVPDDDSELFGHDRAIKSNASFSGWAYYATDSHGKVIAISPQRYK